MVPMARIERATSPLPRECSTTELHGLGPLLLPCGRLAASPVARHCCCAFLLTSNSQAPCGRLRIGAGEGNRTLVISLEGFCSTIELHPRFVQPARSSPAGCAVPWSCPSRSWWRGKDSNLRRQSRQIYSLLPLTAREPLRRKLAMIASRGQLRKFWMESRPNARHPKIRGSTANTLITKNQRAPHTNGVPVPTLRRKAASAAEITRCRCFL